MVAPNLGITNPEIVNVLFKALPSEKISVDIVIVVGFNLGFIAYANISNLFGSTKLLMNYF
jgi:hypothetical protein